MKIIENTDGLFYWETVDGENTTSSIPFEKDSDTYKEKLDEGFELVLIDPAEKAEAEKAALKEQAVATVQSIVDSEAQARGYDDINSAAKYTGFNNSFRAESEALLVWCASCWDKLIEIQDTAKTVDDIVSTMPKFVL